MNILVLIRQVLDAEENVQIDSNAISLDRSKLVMDTMDEYGVEEALLLRDQGTTAEIIAIAVGPPRTQEALRTALAMGADRAIHVESTLPLDPIAVSKVIAALAREESADLILTGGQQADWDSHALGPAIAERLNWSQITWTNQLALAGTTLSGRHDTDTGSESFILQLPALITTQQGLNEPRYPSLPGIMKARKKELRKETLDRFEVTPTLTIKKSEIQTKDRLHKILDGKDAPAAAAELVRLLRHEARAIA